MEAGLVIRASFATLEAAWKARLCDGSRRQSIEPAMVRAGECNQRVMHELAIRNHHQRVAMLPEVGLGNHPQVEESYLFSSRDYRQAWSHVR